MAAAESSYSMSEAFVAATRREWILTSAVAFGVLIALVPLIMSPEDWRLLVASVGLVPLLAFAVIHLLIRLSLTPIRLPWHELRWQQLHLRPHSLLLETRESRHEIPWFSVARIRIKNASGRDVRSLELFTEAGERLKLEGFESMDQIADEIRRAVGPETVVETR